MDVALLLLLVALGVAVAVLTVLLKRERDRSDALARSTPAPPKTPPPAVQPSRTPRLPSVATRPRSAPARVQPKPKPQPPPPSAIAIGMGDSRAMEIRLLHEGRALVHARKLDNPALKTALASIPQALPQLALTQQVVGTNLMEVVIRGDLVRAADGVGWRAFAMGPGGIEQNARLLSVGGLQSLAAGVMVWQVASIVFGQKHLMDIRRQLDTIKAKLDQIIGLLRNDRKGKILAAFRYVADVVHAAEQGELSRETRQQLEAIEYELAVALYSMRADFHDVGQRPLAEDLAGTQNRFESLKSAIHQRHAILEDMSACIEVRQACCYAASLFGARSVLLRKRLDGLRQDVDEFEELGRRLNKTMRQTAAEITSRWNKEATLEERRGDICAIVDSVEESVTENTCRHAARGVLIEKAMSSMNETRTLLVTGGFNSEVHHSRCEVAQVR